MRCRMGDVRAFFPEGDEPTDRSRAPGTGIRSRRHREPSRDGTSPEAAGGRRAEGTERPGWEGAGSGPAPSFVLLPGPLDFSGPLAVAVRSQCLFGEVFFFFSLFFSTPLPFFAYAKRSRRDSFYRWLPAGCRRDPFSQLSLKSWGLSPFRRLEEKGEGLGILWLGLKHPRSGEHLPSPGQARSKERGPTSPCERK